MDLRRRLVAELRRRSDDGRVLDLPPSELAGAASAVLGADGAGISLVQSLVRLPVGGSDDEACVAEQVQASLGSGPCVDAVERRVPVLCDDADLIERWPLYHRVLTARTRLRTTLSLPLQQTDGEVFAVLDVFSRDPRWRPSDELATIRTEVGDLVGMVLLVSVLGSDARRAWTRDAGARRREQVWVSIGMTCEAFGVSDGDALSMLRAYAFTHDLLLDEVAEQMLTGRLLPEHIAVET